MAEPLNLEVLPQRANNGENPRCPLEELLTERRLALLGHTSTGKSSLASLLGHVC